MVVIVFGAGLIMLMRVLRGGGSAVDRRRARRVEAVRAIGTYLPPRRNGRCKSNGTRCRNRTPDRLVLGLIDGRQPLPTLRQSIAGARIPASQSSSEREYWRMRHDAIESNPNPRCC